MSSTASCWTSCCVIDQVSLSFNSLDWVSSLSARLEMLESSLLIAVDDGVVAGVFMLFKVKL